MGRERGQRQRGRPLRRLSAPQARRPAADPHGARRRVPARVMSAGLQLRVAVAAAVAIVVAVAALGVAVLARLDAQLEAALDRSLRVRATEVARLEASTPDLLLRPGTLEGRLGGSPVLVQVIDPRRRIVARSSALGSRVLPEAPVVRAALDERRGGYGDARLGADRVRVYVAPLGELGRGPAAGGAVIVAGTTAEIEETLDTTRRFVLLASVAAALPAAPCDRSGGCPPALAPSSAPATRRSACPTRTHATR